MTITMRSTAGFPAAALAIAVCLVALPGCRREKPNANADLQKSQRQLMDDMDKIAAQIEVEEKSKKEKTPPAPPTAPADAPPPSEQKAPSPEPSPTPPGGG